MSGSKSLRLPCLLLVILAGMTCGKHSTDPDSVRRILFDSGNYYKSEIYTVCEDGTSLIQLTHTGDYVRNFDATWAPDGSRMIFCRAYWTESDPGWEVMYIMDADGSNERKLRDFGGYPLFSPDGRELAFWVEQELYTMNPHGSEEHFLIRDEGAEPVRGYSWSPDGSQIVYCTDEGDHKIYRVNSDGTGRQELATGIEPRWSPDGSLIAYTSDPWSDPWLVNIFVMRADGSDKCQLTDFATTVQRASWPVWSPDGSQILFGLYSTEEMISRICIMNSNGSDQKVLTDNNDRYPEWSPDGSRIAYMCDQRLTDEWQIWVMNVDGSDQAKLTTSGGYHPTWEP
jgi:Tol biopolymer transport system component